MWVWVKHVCLVGESASNAFTSWNSTSLKAMTDQKYGDPTSLPRAHFYSISLWVCHLWVIRVEYAFPTPFVSLASKDNIILKKLHSQENSFSVFDSSCQFITVKCSKIAEYQIQEANPRSALLLLVNLRSPVPFTNVLYINKMMSLGTFMSINEKNFLYFCVTF